MYSEKNNKCIETKKKKLEVIHCLRLLKKIEIYLHP